LGCMAMQIETRTIAGNNLTELFISASARPETDPRYQAQEIFHAIREILTKARARILQERVFGTREALAEIAPIRAKYYVGLDDNVQPAWLVVPEGANGRLAGVQVHAATGIDKIDILHLEGRACGRIARANGRAYLTLSGIRAPEAGSPAEQARRMLEKSETLLKDAGIDLFAVPRTWMWLGDILDWYDDFNGVRNRFFTERGLLGRRGVKMPASTGIGIGPNNGAICAMDLTAVVEPRDALSYLDAGGNQDSAFRYGSAFSRGARALSPAGSTIFVSGTASIGPDGKTTNIGNARAQIADTIENVRAILRQMDCTDDDVVHSLIYCKTSEVERLFCKEFSGLCWPKITMIADVCRDNLLFEIEATAARPD
jgi:enamine deaminase RidA (YjgF/YER057c/UK114 family)